MDCKQLEHHLATDPEAPLGAEEEAHLAACQVCQDLRADLLLLREVGHEGAPELPSGFELDLRRRLYQTDERSQRATPDEDSTSVRRVGLVLALAAAVVLILGGGLLARHWLDSGAPAGDAAPGTYHQLRLAVNVQAALDARFELELPQGVRLAGPAAEALGSGGRPGWQSRLKPGTNVIELPLQAAPGAAERPVLARLTVGQRVYRAEVSLTRASVQRTGDASGPQLAWVLEGVPR
jgi:hypothetical protein